MDYYPELKRFGVDIKDPAPLSVVRQLRPEVSSQLVDEIEQIALERAPVEACGLVAWGRPVPLPATAAHPASFQVDPGKLIEQDFRTAPAVQGHVVELENRWSELSLDGATPFHADHTPWDAYAFSDDDVWSAVDHLHARQLRLHPEIEMTSVEAWLVDLLIWHSHPRGTIGPSRGDLAATQDHEPGLRFGVIAISLALDLRHQRWSEWTS